VFQPTADSTCGQLASIPAASSTFGFVASMGVVYPEDVYRSHQETR